MNQPVVTFAPCLSGRLSAAYPASRHDLEVVVERAAPAELSLILARAAAEILEQQPRCRKIIYAATANDIAAIAAAEAAGFRYVVDVDVEEAGQVIELALLVREPEFVSRLGRV